MWMETPVCLDVQIASIPPATQADHAVQPVAVPADCSSPTAATSRYQILHKDERIPSAYAQLLVLNRSMPEVTNDHMTLHTI